MNEDAKRDMFTQMSAQIQRDNITNFDDVESYVTLYKNEYQRLMKHGKGLEVRFFTRKEIKETVHKPYKIRVGDKTLKVIEYGGNYFYSIYDLGSKFATSDHAISSVTYTKDLERLAEEETMSFRVSNQNLAKYTTKKGIIKSHQLMQYEFYDEMMEQLK